MSADPGGALKRRLAALPARLRDDVRDALAGAGQAAAVDAARRLAAGAGPGPSAPGAPPRDPSGRLAAALGVEPDSAGVGVVVTVASPEAAFLEYGTRSMAARPFLRPARDATRPAALAACRAALARAAASLKEPGP